MCRLTSRWFAFQVQSPCDHTLVWILSSLFCHFSYFLIHPICLNVPLFRAQTRSQRRYAEGSKSFSPAHISTGECGPQRRGRHVDQDVFGVWLPNDIRGNVNGFAAFHKWLFRMYVLLLTSRCYMPLLQHYIILQSQCRDRFQFHNIIPVMSDNYEVRWIVVPSSFLSFQRATLPTTALILQFCFTEGHNFFTY